MTDQNGRRTHRLASRSLWLEIIVLNQAAALCWFGKISGPEWAWVVIAVVGYWFGRDSVLKFKGVAS